jgi:hypothetical protein
LKLVVQRAKACGLVVVAFGVHMVGELVLPLDDVHRLNQAHQFKPEERQDLAAYHPLLGEPDVFAQASL